MTGQPTDPPLPSDEQIFAVVDVLRSSTIVWASLHDEAPTDYEYAELAGEILGTLAALSVPLSVNTPKERSNERRIKDENADRRVLFLLGQEIDRDAETAIAPSLPPRRAYPSLRR